MRVPWLLRRVEAVAEEAVAHASSVPVDPATVELRLRFVLVFAAIFGLSDADTATIGAAATELRHGLGLSNFQLGALSTAATAVGALATLPAGALVDRVHRIRLLSWSVVLWAVAMAASTFAVSFWMLLATRLLLGSVLAVSGPATASLLGDLWPSSDRGRIYGIVTSGELVGAGVGFVLSGELAAASWRLAFLVLALPAVALAWAIRRLPEPSRTRSRLGAPPAAPGAVPDPTGLSAGASPPAAPGPVPTTTRSLWGVVRYVLSIPTNIILIVTGALSYFFLAAVEAFGEEFAKAQYGLSQVVVTLVLLVVGIGAVIGAVLSGRASDAVVRRGRRQGRIDVGVWATLLSVVAFVPALLTGNVLVAVPLLSVGTFGLAAVNPPLDATRLEVVNSSVWGRAEAVRTVLRTGLQAAAPVSFGFLSDHLAGGGNAGLRAAFLIMLVPLLLGGLLLVLARRTYPQDRERALEEDRRAARARRGPVGPVPSAGVAPCPAP